MSHEIELDPTTGAASFFGARKPAWHRLGTITAGAVDAETAITLGGLDWQVTSEPQYVDALGNEGVTRLTSPDVANVRISPFTGLPEILGTVSPDYRIIQNHALAPILNGIVAESGATFETAGSLRGGREVFISMKLPKGILVGGVDLVENYLVAMNAHTGLSSLQIVVTPIRVVCANTAAVAMRHNAASIKIRHTGDVDEQLAQARTALGITVDYLAEFESIANQLFTTEMTNTAFDKFIKAVWPEKDRTHDKTDRGRNNDIRRDDTLRQLFKVSPTNEVGRGTQWAAFNSVTEYVDHFKSPNEDVNARRVASGDTSEVKNRALSLLVG